MSKHKGEVHWKLYDAQKLIDKGRFDIIANEHTKTYMESYLGPPSIIAGGEDYTMMVTAPTDSLDNPLATGTPVLIKHQFLEMIRIDALETKDMIAWKNIFSYDKSGRILVTNECKNENSKEFMAVVFPDNAVDFTINLKREHRFADGNQVTILQTSVIRDQYDNIVTDGTYVLFFVENSQGEILKTPGLTIKGVATAEILHPDYEENWKIRAYVIGLAKSDEIEVYYEPLHMDYDVMITDQGRWVVVGPLKSFMKQIIPDGAMVKIYLYQNEDLIDYKVDTSLNGKVKFEFLEDFYPDGDYTFRIEALGITKEIDCVKLW